MAKSARKLFCPEKELQQLRAWTVGRSVRPRLAERARIVLLALEGMANSRIAIELATRPNTVAKWRSRFERNGLVGLYDAPRPGAAPRYPREETRERVLTLVERSPPSGRTSWSGKTLAAALGISPDKVWRILRKEGIRLSGAVAKKP